MPDGGSPLRDHESAGGTVMVDGLRLFHRVAGPAGGTPVVLAHGLPHSSFLWRRMIPALARRRPVRAWDLYGFGLSEKPEEPGRYRFAEFERVFGLYVEALGAARVHLVCHDIAGPFVLGWAGRHPGRVASLTVMNTALGLGGFRLPALVAAGIALPWALQRALVPDHAWSGLLWRYARRTALADPEALAGADGEAFRSLLERAGGRRAVTRVVRAYLGLPAYLARVRRGLAALRCPAQLVWGARDPFCTLGAARRVAALLPGAPLRVLAGASHFVPEDAPEAAAAAVLELAERA